MYFLKSLTKNGWRIEAALTDRACVDAMIDQANKNKAAGFKIAAEYQQLIIVEAATNVLVWDFTK